MSTGLECIFFSVVESNSNPVKGKWYYLLQDGNCPTSVWDWREYASCYGPFWSEDAAYEHLSRYHANPGGWSTISDVDLDKDLVLKKCVEGSSK